MGQSAQVLIALGSNMGDREQYLTHALQKFAAHGLRISKTSSIYETAPVGRADQTFYNAAVLIETHIAPLPCMQSLLLIEHELGRQRQIHWGNRTIDLDIILWRNPGGEPLVMTTSQLTTPHPRLLERDFVLVPCAEVAPEWLYPGTRKTLAQFTSEAGYQLTPAKPFPAFE